MIYNRTILDVNNAKTIIAKFQALYDWSSITQDEIDTLERGTYTIVSLNRVEQKVAELATVFRSAGYSYTNPETKTDWAYLDYFDKDQHQRFFENIEYLRNIIPVSDTTPQSPFISDGMYTYGDISYLLANDSEKILYDISVLLDYITSPLYYRASGAYASGQHSQLWRAAKINSPRAIIAPYITLIENYEWLLPSTVASEDEAVDAVQDIVDGLLPDTMGGIVTAVFYSYNYGQLGLMKFSVAITYSNVTVTTGTITATIAEITVNPDAEAATSYKASGAYVSGQHSITWRATKINSPTTIISAYINLLESHSWEALPSTVTTADDAVDNVQEQVNNFLPSAFSGAVILVEYATGGAVEFTVAVSYRGTTISTSTLEALADITDLEE